MPADGKCPNCGALYNQNKTIGGLQNRAPDPAGKQYTPYNEEQFVVPNTAIADTGLIYDSKLDKFVIAKTRIEEKREEKEEKKHIEEENAKMYESEEFKQLVGPSDELTQSDDNLDIEQTIKDLAIDG